MNGLASVYRDKSPSRGSRATLVGIHLLIVGAVVWLLFGGGIGVLDNLLGRPDGIASLLRRSVLVAAAVLYFSRTLPTIFVFLKRRIPWSEVITIALFVLAIDLLMAYFGGRNERPFGIMEVVGAALLITGSAIHTGAELQRYLWKRQPANAGHLYSGGLFRFARHVNYFGDEVLFTGWVLMTGLAALLVIPAVMFVGFVFGNIPALDRYLAERYGEEYQDYAARVKRFIPFIY